MVKLKEIRQQKGLTQSQVADFLNIPRSTYSNYENNISEPTMAMLIKMTEIFDVSADYILGINKSNQYANKLDQELLNYTNQLDDLEKAKVIGYAKSRVEQQKENRYNDLKNRLGG